MLIVFIFQYIFLHLHRHLISSRNISRLCFKISFFLNLYLTLCTYKIASPIILNYPFVKKHTKSYLAMVQLCSHPNHIFANQQPAAVVVVAAMAVDVVAISWLCGLAYKATCCQIFAANWLHSRCCCSCCCCYVYVVCHLFS